MTLLYETERGKPFESDYFLQPHFLFLQPLFLQPHMRATTHRPRQSDRDVTSHGGQQFASSSRSQ